MGALVSTSPSDDLAVQEWKEARKVLGRYDDNLHDLRKYSFSFIVALLAADGLLSQGSDFPLPVKATIIIATYGLIVAVRLLDKHYRQFQAAASLRAKMLENRLNLDLTTDISIYYNLGSWWNYVQVLYYALVFLAGLVGVAVLWPSPTLVIAVFEAGLLSGILIWAIDLEQINPLADWSVDRFVLKEGDPLRITFTDLDPSDKEDLRNSAKSVWGTFDLEWSILEYGGLNPAVLDSSALQMGVQNTQTPDRTVLGDDDLHYLGPRDWLSTMDFPPGLYKLKMEATKSGTKKKHESGTIEFNENKAKNPLLRSHVVEIVIQVIPRPVPE